MKGNCHVGKVTEKQICVNVKLVKKYILLVVGRKNLSIF